MRIGVISDTHLRGYDTWLQGIIDTHFNTVDLVLHAGDIVDLSVLSMFSDRDLKVVCGNMDIGLSTCLPTKLEFTLEGIRFGLIHGWGNPGGLRDKLRREFAEIDCIVYGHTHQAYNAVKEGILYFNPGSTSGNYGLSQKTIGILEINNGISGKIIQV